MSALFDDPAKALIAASANAEMTMHSDENGDISYSILMKYPAVGMNPQGKRFRGTFPSREMADSYRAFHIMNVAMMSLGHDALTSARFVSQLWASNGDFSNEGLIHVVTAAHEEVITSGVYTAMEGNPVAT